MAANSLIQHIIDSLSFNSLLRNAPKNRGFFFLQNNTDFQTILLVSMFSKLFRKLNFECNKLDFGMLNSSPSDSFSVKLKLSLINSISILTQQKQKQWRTSKKQTQTHFQKILFSNNQTQKTHFQKLFFSNNQTQQPRRNNNINKPKTHLGFCSDRIA